MPHNAPDHPAQRPAPQPAAGPSARPAEQPRPDVLAGPPPTLALLSGTVDLAFLAPAFKAARPDVVLRYLGDLGPLEAIDAAVCWMAPHGVVATLPRLQLIQSLAAGIDHLTNDPALPADLPLCRIVDTEMASGMAAYVTWAVVQHQRHMGTYLAQRAQHQWQGQPVQPPREHTVGIAGLGWLGQHCARALQAIGYTVRGWRRSADSAAPEGVAVFHGDAALDDFLSGCDTLVCLLPLTEATRGILNAQLFAQLPRGAHLVNVGRGDHLVEADLLAALDAGQLGAATLDAFAQEPLPPQHPFWQHPRITVTPHIATRTPAAVIAKQTLANLAAVRAGRAHEVAVDRRRGY